MRKIATVLTALVCLVLADAGLFAAAYVKFDGIDGESKDASGHSGWIELNSVTQTLHKPGTGGSSARPGGDVVLEDITVSKTADKASPKLAEAVCKGRVFPKVEIHVTASYDDAGRQTYYAYELENVRISSYSVSTSGSEGVPMEEISLNFEKIKVDYGDASKAKSKSKGNVEYGWKVEEAEN